jgi:hypothetical protein
LRCNTYWAVFKWQAHHDTTKQLVVLLQNQILPHQVRQQWQRHDLFLTDHHILKQRDFLNHLILKFVVLQQPVPKEYLCVCKEVNGATCTSIKPDIKITSAFALQLQQRWFPTNF